MVVSGKKVALPGYVLQLPAEPLRKTRFSLRETEPSDRKLTSYTLQNLFSQRA